MTKSYYFKPLGILAAAAFAFGVAATAQAGGERTFEVTITNLTKGQPLTPAVVIAHKRPYQLFTFLPEGFTSAGLETLAETGSPDALADEAVADPMVGAVEKGAGAIMPGLSETITITVPKGYGWLSVASMLAATNDAFAAVRGLRLKDGNSARAVAYDAGTEDNLESAATVPALPDGNDDPGRRRGLYSCP